jgi:CNT family concentrative nucleoside transporter
MHLSQAIPPLPIFQGILGIAVFLSLACLFSTEPKQIHWKHMWIGLGLHIVLTFVILKTGLIQHLFYGLNMVVSALQNATHAGTAFVFGYLGGGPTPFEVPEHLKPNLFILAIQSFPVLMVMSALSAVLFYWRVIPCVTKILSWFLERSLGVGGALGLSAASTVFFGTDTAALLVKPHLKHMSRSELFTLMSCGMATVAASVMLLYVHILKPLFPNEGVVLGHILTASLINVPAALIISRLMIPQLGQPTSGHWAYVDQPHSTMDAVARGVSDGLNMLLNILAMLIVLTALVFLLNSALGYFSVQGTPLTLQKMAGFLFAPIAWLMGLPASEIFPAGGLLGIKIVLNEIFAYQGLTEQAHLFSEHSRLILTYALCGFSNFTSVGIIIGGVGILVPERRIEIVELSLKSIVSGALANCLSGTVVGLLT